MIIELFGLPATGKTTIAKILHQEGDFQHVKIRGPIEIIWFNLLFCLKHPLVAFQIFTQVYKSPRHFFNFFLYRNAKYEKALKYKAAVIDEGLFQNLLSVLEKPVDRDRLLTLAQNLPKPDLLVIVEISTEERQQRIHRRGTLVRANREYFYEEFLKILPALKLNYLKVDAQDSPIAVKHIKNYVENH